MRNIIDIISSHHSQLDSPCLRIMIEEFHYIDHFASHLLKEINYIPTLLAYTPQHAYQGAYWIIVTVYRFSVLLGRSIISVLLSRAEFLPSLSEPNKSDRSLQTAKCLAPLRQRTIALVNIWPTAYCSWTPVRGWSSHGRFLDEIMVPLKH